MERNTLQKKIILDVLKKSRSHPSAEQLYDEIHKNYPHISKATVYRNLKNMALNGQIKKLEINDSNDRYDHYSNHYHAKCIKCNNIYDIDIDYQKNIDKKLANNFNVLGHDIIFKIICNKCREEN